MHIFTEVLDGFAKYDTSFTAAPPSIMVIASCEVCGADNSSYPIVCISEACLYLMKSSLKISPRVGYGATQSSFRYYSRRGRKNWRYFLISGLCHMRPLFSRSHLLLDFKKVGAK